MQKALKFIPLVRLLLSLPFTRPSVIVSLNLRRNALGGSERITFFQSHKNKGNQIQLLNFFLNYVGNIANLKRQVPKYRKISFE